MKSFLFSTPIPLAVAFLLLMTLKIPKIASKWWAKLGRWLCIAFFAIFFWNAQQIMNEKGTTGIRKSDAHEVTVFTNEITHLISQGKHQKAKELLDTFNDKYPALSGHDEAKKFLESLVEAAKREGTSNKAAADGLR
jgi:hypothetical protein